MIEDRIQKSTDEAADVLTRLRLPGYASISIRKFTVPGTKMWVKLLGTEQARDPVLDYRINFPRLSQEFAATFRFMLDEYCYELWEERKRGLSQQRLKGFYRRILRLDKILTEYKRKAKVPNFPSHVLAIDARYVIQFGGAAEAEYYPAGELSSGYVIRNYNNTLQPVPLPTNVEQIRQKQSMCIVYSQTSPLRLEGRFIHELIHHIQDTAKLEITEDERVMLETAKQYMKDSWIISRFDEFITQDEKTRKKEHPSC